MSSVQFHPEQPSDTDSDTDIDSDTDSDTDSDFDTDTDMDTGTDIDTDGSPINGVKVIFETDMTFDVDDVGALAVLHGLQNEGYAEILAVTYNEVHPDAAAGIDAINTYYKRGNIPIGIYDKSLSSPDPERYLAELRKMDHDLSDNTVDTALNVYKQVLDQQPDNSVVILSVGFLNNLHDLLQDPAGFDLVQRKVEKLAVMGGFRNDGFNFVRHDLVGRTEYVLRNWPGPLVITDAGGRMITGKTLSGTTPQHNPVRKAYELWMGGPNMGRSSWDQVTCLYGVFGTEYFGEKWTGTGCLRNGYAWDLSNPDRGYAKPICYETLEDEIERLMTLPPIAGQ